MNWTKVCGANDYVVWEDGHLHSCFLLTLILPSSVLLAAVSVFLLWRRRRFVINPPVVKKLRLFASSASAISSFVRLLLLIFRVDDSQTELTYGDGVCLATEIISWWLVTVVIALSVENKILHWSILVRFVVGALELWSHSSQLTDLHVVNFSFSAVNIGLLLCFFTSLVPVTSPKRDQTSPNLLISDSASYGTFSSAGIEDKDALHGEDEANCLSRLLFVWAWGLLSKGNQNKIYSVRDLHELPHKLSIDAVRGSLNKQLGCRKVKNRLNLDDALLAQPSTSISSQPVFAINTESSDTFSIGSDSYSKVEFSADLDKANNTLFRTLNFTFGKEFYSLVFIKVTGDALSFCGPLLLNYLVSFLEDPQEEQSHGYYYALGLFGSALLSAVSNTHFSYSLGKVGLKVRYAVVCCVYRKLFLVSSAAIHDSSLTNGQLLNLASSDADRIVNYCQSFHQLWSLPVQIGLALYLLYQQIGISFLTGLAYTLILIPINRLLAKKIAHLSQQRMDRKDKRIKVTEEVICGIRSVKLNAWEKLFSNKMVASREEELKFLRQRQYLDAMCVYFWATTPVMIAVSTFVTYSLLGHELTAPKVFTCLALFGMLVTPLNAFPWVINGIMEAWVSLERVQNFLNLDQVDKNQYYGTASGGVQLDIKDGVFKWQQEGKFKLGTLSLSLAEGNLLGVVGRVGTGKSSLLASLLGEMHCKEGTVGLSRPDLTWAFVAQEPWIQNSTIRGNILCGLPLRSKRYADVLQACALLPDLELMPAGDETEVGSRGAALSGGQKSRLTLARALYQNKDIYLLDDPFAAVDAHVAEHLNRYFIGMLKSEGKTIIVCTHHHRFLHQADHILILQNGRLIRQGKPEDVLQGFKTITHNEKNEEEGKPDTDIVGESQLVREEEKAQGAVRLSVYGVYWKAVGHAIAVVILISLVLMQASKVFSDGWLTFWVSNNNNGTNATNLNVTTYLSVYGCTALVNGAMTLIRAFAFAYGGVKAARAIHDQLLSVILKAPVSFFDATPSGRLLNRFSSDLNMVDDSLPFILNIFLDQVSRVAAILVVTSFSLPLILVVYIPLFLAYLYVQNFYRKTSREVKRLCTLTLSPLYSHMSETLDGLMTIKAMGASERFCKENDAKLEANTRANYSGLVASSWLTFNLQIMGVVVISSVAVLSVLQHHYNIGGKASPALIGLAVSYALSMTSLLSGVVTSFTEVEKEMVSVERISQYVDDMPSEKSEGIIQPPFSWPVCGVLTFEDVHLRYSNSNEDALHGVSFEIKTGEKIGIVGRTGSGKTSLLQAIFRIVEISSGQVLIDAVNVAQLDMKVLRSRLCIIPQEPFLFTGSIRDNLDPDKRHTDSELWHVLEQCRLSSSVRHLGGLESSVGQGGRSLSQGQKQLLCLARALLVRTKIICLDEATASVDPETDESVQKTLRETFRDTTVLTVAHRLQNVINCDRVLVMSRGKLVESGSPAELMKRKNSEFSKLLEKSS